MTELVARARTIIRRPPAEVFAAFVQAEAMGQFWFTRRDNGLRQGASMNWYIGDDEDAPAIPVRVVVLIPAERIEILWGDSPASRVCWHMQPTGEGHCLLTIEERGFAGSQSEMVERALDSTGGFNQVVIAAKAFVEHGVAMNIVADHG